ncbi:hypothetical protein KM043_008248 [Ampulex compressa]|nr:hypothetical protein KM043_008248 [Ampulex compressa]
MRFIGSSAVSRCLSAPSTGYEQPPFYFPPTYHFTCPTRGQSSYHGPETRHISPSTHTLAHLPAELVTAWPDTAILVPVYHPQPLLNEYESYLSHPCNLFMPLPGHRIYNLDDCDLSSYVSTV